MRSSVLRRRTRTVATKNANVILPMLRSVDDWSEDLEAYKTCPEVWTAPTLGEAWRKMVAAIARADKTDPPVAATLRSIDLPALAKASSRAELRHLLSYFPEALRDKIISHPDFSADEVEEFYLHAGQCIEMRTFGSTTMFDDVASIDDVRTISKAVGGFGHDGRGTMDGTLHRISRFASREGQVLGCTLRIGKYVPNVGRAVSSLAPYGNVLVLSKPGAGKTTVLRDVCATLSSYGSHPRVTVVDTSNEIGGDSPVPLPYLGRARRMQVPKRSEQLAVMTQAVQNHSCEFLVVDEISNAEEAEASWTMAHRGINLIATAHGETLERLVQNRALNLCVGGTVQAFLSNEERKLKGKLQKTVLERPYNSPFDFVLEIISRGRGRLYHQVNHAVDCILDGGNVLREHSLYSVIDLGQPISVPDLPGMREQSHMLGGLNHRPTHNRPPVRRKKPAHLAIPHYPSKKPPTVQEKTESTTAATEDGEVVDANGFSNTFEEIVRQQQAEPQQ